MADREVLRVRQVWKKYCRNLKRAMWYGLRDVGAHLLGWHRQRPVKDNLRVGEFYAVKNASFDLPPGQCLAMIGPNGAGKSTMLKLINGLIRPDAGEICIRGRVGALIELGTGFNPILSGRENVYINAAVLGMQRREVDVLFDDIVDFAELGHVIDDPIKTYSSGMRVRLGYSVAAHIKPELLIMDEVLAVGDVGFRMKCFQHLNSLVAQGVSIILVTHAVGMLPRVANRVILFEQGRITFDGDVSEGIARYEACMALRTVKDSEQNEAVRRGAEITKAIVVDQAGRPVEEVCSGDSIALRIYLQCHRTLRGLRIVANLRCGNVETLASMSSPYQGLQLDLGVGEHLVELAVHSLPLLVGGYSFDISLYGPDLRDFIQRRTGLGTFRVTGPPIDVNGKGLAGLIRLEHRWRLLGTQSEA